MAEFAAAPSLIEPSLFQLEVPLGGAVGIIDQHQMRIMFQSFGLQFHRAAVLFDKFREDEFQESRCKREPAK